MNEADETRTATKLVWGPWGLMISAFSEAFFKEVVSGANERFPRRKGLRSVALCGMWQWWGVLEPSTHGVV